MQQWAITEQAGFLNTPCKTLLWAKRLDTLAYSSYIKEHNSAVTGNRFVLCKYMTIHETHKLSNVNLKTQI